MNRRGSLGERWRKEKRAEMHATIQRLTDENERLTRAVEVRDAKIVAGINERNRLWVEHAKLSDAGLL